jgi:hypothetical protein
MRGRALGYARRMKPILSMLMVLAIAGAAGIAGAEQAGGVTWKAPAEWTAQGERPMRAATYRIPPAKGDAEAAELAVFYFGAGGGGGVDANIKRWIDQFQQPDGKPVDKVAMVKKETLSGLPASTVDVKGTYTGGGPSMGVSTPRPGYRLLGAIVEGPGGNVFFKLTGPDKTVTAAEKPFRAMLGALKK